MELSDQAVGISMSWTVLAAQVGALPIMTRDQVVSM